MKKSLLAQFLLTPILISAAVFFAGISPPIGAINSNSAKIQAMDVIVLILNLEVGISFIGVTGWYLSTRKLAFYESQYLEIQQQIEEKETEIQVIVKSLQSRISAN